MSPLLSDVHAGRRFGVQTTRHDVSREVSNSENGETGDCFVLITHLALTFYLYEMGVRVVCVNGIIPPH
jgi:hypothetical protein